MCGNSEKSFIQFIYIRVIVAKKISKLVSVRSPKSEIHDKISLALRTQGNLERASLTQTWLPIFLQKLMAHYNTFLFTKGENT